MAGLQSTLKLTLLDNVTAGARRVTGALSGIERHSSGLTAFAGRLAAFAGAYIGVTEGFDRTYAAASKMQAAMTEIGIKANLSQTQLGSMQQRLAALAPKVNQTTTELVSGVDAMLTMGLAADKAMGAIPAIGKAATATGASVQDLSNASTSAMQNLGVLPEEVTKMLDGMAYAGNAGAFELRDMAQYFPQLTASAQFLGVKGVAGVNDMAAALQIARRGAGDASTAANNLANFMDKIVTPQTVKNFKKFGVDVTKELQYAKKKGISPIEHFIKLIDAKTNGGQSDLLTQIFGDKQVMDFVRPMIAGYQDYLKIRDQANAAQGTVDAAYAQRMESNAEKVKAFQLRIENLGTSIGAGLLKPVADAADYLNGIIDSLGERVTIFDRMEQALSGFASGFGSDGLGGIAKDLEQFFFGVKDGSAAADELGRIFARFQSWGRSVREFTEAIKNNPIGKFLIEVAGSTLKYFLAAAAIGAVASSMWKLAQAASRLSGLTSAVEVVKSLNGAASPGGKPGAPVPPDNKPPGGGMWSLGRILGLINYAELVAAIPNNKADLERFMADNKASTDVLDKQIRQYIPSFLYRDKPQQIPGYTGTEAQLAAQRGVGYTPLMAAVDGAARPVAIDASSIAAMTQPSGVQDVKVTNQQPVSVSVSVSQTISGSGDPQAVGAAAAAGVGQQVKAAVESSFGAPE